MKVPRERWLLELRRKSIHLLTGIVPLSYALFFTRWQAATILAVFLAAVCIVEWLRRRKDAVGAFCCRTLYGFLREEEQSGERLMGTTPYCAASLVCVLVFPKPIAVLALLYLAVGDTAASLVGLGWGYHKVDRALFGQKAGRKSLEGAIAFTLACAVIGFLAHYLAPEYPLIGGLIAAPVAACAELLLPDYDDNWTVPLAAAACMLACAWLGID